MHNEYTTIFLHMEEESKPRHYGFGSGKRIPQALPKLKFLCSSVITPAMPLQPTVCNIVHHDYLSSRHTNLTTEVAVV